ncbi:MAG: hypothetical protein WB755_24450 [Terriglobales bacterium]
MTKSLPSKTASFLATCLLMGTVLIGTVLNVPAAFAADKPQSLTGKVSDAMCGANHMMAGAGSDCVRACVQKGSKYALVVGDKVYVLDTSDKAMLDKLDKLADKQAKVTGQVNGDSVTVSSVSEAR